MAVFKNMKRLQTARDARQFMQAVINSFDKQEIDQQEARCYGYLIKVFLDTVEASDIEQRIEQLEEFIDQQHRRTG